MTQRRTSDDGGLRSRVEVRVSPVHGRGLFARKRLRAGQFIGTFTGRETKRDGTHVLWVHDENGSATGIEGDNDLRFLNHSKRPNADFDGFDLYAVRNIQAGAELFIDYGDAWGDVE